MRDLFHWLARVGRFIQQMFPFFPAQLAILGNFVVTYSIMAAIFVPGPMVGIELICGGLSMLIFNLLLRIFDELKDYDSDKINFPDRPLVKGTITHGDLRILISLLLALIFFLQVPFLLRPVLRWMIVCLGFCFLMLKWFFAEKKIRKSLPLALATHHPIVFLFQLYVLSFFGNPTQLPGQALQFVFGTGLCATAWELGRKMRGTKQETSYTTYTKIWGVRGASAVMGAVVTASLLLTYFPLSDVSGSDAARAAWLLPAAGWIAMMVQLVRFVRKPQKAPALLKTAEAYGLLTLLGMMLAAMFG